MYTCEDSAVRLAKFNYKRTVISEVNDGATLRAPSINEGGESVKYVGTCALEHMVLLSTFEKA